VPSLIARPSARTALEPVRLRSATSDTATTGKTSDPLRLSVATVVLLATCILAKGVLLPVPAQTQGELARWLVRLAIVSSADVAFVLLLAAGCGVLRHLIANRQRAAFIWRVGVCGALGLSAAYAVVSIALLRLMMVPLTIDLLSFAGGPRLMASSIREATTPGLLSGLTAALLAVLASFGLRVPSGFASARYRSIADVSWHGWLALASAGGLLAAGGQIYIHKAWTDPNRWERRISPSPHATLLMSALRPWASSSANARLDETDCSDFEPSAASQTSQTTPLSAAAPTNLLVVVLESVGADYLSLYGAQHQTTPRLAQLAAERGVVFENVYAHAPSSPKGLVALTASVYPRIDWKLITRDCPEFDVPNLTQVVKSEGYRTAYLHSGYWSWKLRDRYLAARGVDDVLDAESIPGEEIFSWGISDQTMFQAALDWIDRDPSRPFHALLWTIETHHPYIADDASPHFDVPDPELARYLSAIESADRRIAWLYEQLIARGLEQNTLVVVTGDHGEVFGQHNQRVHSFGVYDENVRVPLVLLHPRLREMGFPSRQPAVCQQIDIPPTLLSLLGATQPAVWQGRDALQHEPAPRAYFYSVSNEIQLAVREGNWKYIYRLQSHHEELYDLAEDPDELHNLAPLHPERTASFRRRVAGLLATQREFLAQHGAP
jgi:arylsulfatase A-like enzyme